MEMENGKGVLCWRGNPGMSGPAGITNIETGAAGWNEKHVQLQNLCFPIVKFMQENPEIASTVIITQDSINSKIE